MKGPVDLHLDRRAAAWRTRRLIVNDDGTQCRLLDDQELEERTYYPVNPNTCAHTHENFLALRARPLLDGPVDTLVYCTGVFNHYSHHSQETELLKFAGNNSPDWAWELGTKGEDTLATMVRFCRDSGTEVFWSFRMNDSHDSYLPSLLPQWKRENPALLMGRPGQEFPSGINRWSLLNYQRPEVHEKVLAILRDVAQRYDLDGIELDFYRHPVFFEPQMRGQAVTDAQRAVLTDLMRRIRALLDAVAAKRGRPLILMIRLPDSEGFRRAIGIDLPAWLEEKLADILVGGGYYLFEPWERLVELGHAHDVPVYPCLSASRIGYGEAHGLRGAVLDPWRSEAAAAWNAGADGVYLFNTAHDPTSPIYRELGCPEALADVAPHVDAGINHDEFMTRGERYVKLRRG